LELRLVTPDRKVAEQGLPELRHAILVVLGQAVRLDVEFVDKIPRTSSGKHRAVMSEIPVII